MSLEHDDKSNYYSQDIFYFKGPVEYASEVWPLSGWRCCIHNTEENKLISIYNNIFVNSF
jgi:hypothetical protein